MKKSYFFKPSCVMRKLLLGGLCFFSTISFYANGQTMVVNSTADGGRSELQALADQGKITLRYAIQYSTARDVVKFDASLAGDTIVLTRGSAVQFLSPNTRTLLVDGEDMNVTISGGSLQQIFFIEDTQTEMLDVTIRNLKFINGKSDGDGTTGGANGGAILNAEKLTIENCIFENNNARIPGATAYGGAVAVAKAGGMLTVKNSLFRNNSVSGVGGAVGADVAGSMAVIENCVFIDNRATWLGGGVGINWNITAEMYNNTFYNNSSLFNGGGCALYDSKTTIGGNLFLSNTAGGGVKNGVTLPIVTEDLYAYYAWAGTFNDIGYNVYEANLVFLERETNANKITPYTWASLSRKTTLGASGILTLNNGVKGGYFLTDVGNTETRIVPQSFISNKADLAVDISGVSRSGSLNYNAGAKEYTLNSGLVNPQAKYGELKFFPNPVKDILYFVEPVHSKVELLSIDGKILYSAENIISLDMRKYNQGVYILRTNNTLSKVIKIK